MRPLLLAIYLLVSLCVYSSTKCKGVLLWNLNSLDTIGEDVRKSIALKGDKILKQEYVFVTRKQHSFTGDTHAYESMATYYWQDPSNPNGKYLLKDGQRNPECDQYCVNLMYELSDNLKKLGNAYYVTGDKKYATWALGQIKAWFLNEETYMKPNFEYGQVIPGGSYKKGNVGAISEAYYLIDALEMISLLQDAGLIDKKTNKALKKWFKEFAVWMTTSNIGTKMRDVEDNCGTMYDILLYRICSYTGNKKMCKSIINEFETRRITGQIAEDGSQPRELKRSKAMDYSLYNLQHIIDFFEMIDRDGISYFRNYHERVGLAIAFLGPYIRKEKKFPYTEVGDWSALTVRYARIQKRMEMLKIHL